MGVIVDTCVWVDVERVRLSPADVQARTGTEPVFMSPVTIAELSFGVSMASTPDIRQKRLAALEKLRKKPVLIIDEETGAIFGHLAAELRKMGRAAEYRVQDLWIASQAIQHGFPVLTRNVKDFEDIPGLTLL